MSSQLLGMPDGYTRSDDSSPLAKKEASFQTKGLTRLGNNDGRSNVMSNARETNRTGNFKNPSSQSLNADLIEITVDDDKKNKAVTGT